MQRRLAAILAADVVGYSALMGKDEQRTLERVKALHRELISPKIEERNGRIVKLMGDGWLAEFASVIEAVQCAADIQKSMTDRETDLPHGNRIMLRIGVNLGDVMIDDNDIFGDGVNVAARLEGISEPGGVCVSGQAFDMVEGKVNLPFVYAGLQPLKNIANPVRTYKLDPQEPRVSAALPHVTPQELPSHPSIAVLPFENMSGDADQGYFSDGITEDIITELSRFRHLFVIARNSSFAFREKQVAPRQLGRSLGAQFLVQGSVRKSGDRVRITAQLIEAPTGSQLWAERYDRKLTDIFDVQDEVVAEIAIAVPRVLDAVFTHQVQRRKAENFTAYEYLLKAIHVRRQNWGAPEAVPLLETVIAADPHCGSAYAHLASWYAYSIIAHGADREMARKTTLEMARKACELDPDDATTLSLLADAYLITGDLEMARESLEKAIRINPNSYIVMSNAGTIFAYLGETEKATSWHERLSRHDPVSVETVREGAQVINYLARRFKLSADLFAGFDAPPAHLLPVAAAAFAQIGDSEQAAKLRKQYQAQDTSGASFSKLLETQMRMCATEELRELWRDGYRKAGFAC